MKKKYTNLTEMWAYRYKKRYGGKEGKAKKARELREWRLKKLNK